MENKTFIKTFRASKIIQLCITLLLEIFFIVMLCIHPVLMRDIFSNPTMLTLCTAVWLLFIITLFFLLYDFIKLRSCDAEQQTLKKAAYIDLLTNLPNRHGLDAIFQTYNTPESLANMGCLIAVIKNLDELNTTQGYECGDKLIMKFSSILEDVCNGIGVAGRNGGNEFIAVLNNCDTQAMEEFIKSLNEKVAKHNAVFPELPIETEHSYVINSDQKATDFTHLMTSAYNKMYK